MLWKRIQYVISVPIPLGQTKSSAFVHSGQYVFAIIFLFLLLMEIGSRNMTFSIRLRLGPNENEEEIPITEMIDDR